MDHLSFCILVRPQKYFLEGHCAPFTICNNPWILNKMLFSIWLGDLWSGCRLPGSIFVKPIYIKISSHLYLSVAISLSACPWLLFISPPASLCLEFTLCRAVCSKKRRREWIETCLGSPFSSGCPHCCRQKEGFVVDNIRGADSTWGFPPGWNIACPCYIWKFPHNTMLFPSMPHGAVGLPLPCEAGCKEETMYWLLKP